MVSRTFLIALLFLTSLNFTYLQAQDGACTRRTVAVGVVDDQWNFVQGLTAADFRGKLHGRGVEILSASIDTGPRHIVLLLDASGSMMGEKKWKTAKSFSEDLIRFAPPQAFIAQIAFSGSVLDTEGFAQDPRTLLERLGALVKVCEQPRKTRPTALYDAVASALGTPEGLGFGDIIYAVTDGVDNKSQSQPKRVEADLLRAGVRLFSVLIDYDLAMRGRVLVDAEGPDRLLSVVEATGGNVLTLPYAAASESIPLSHIKARTFGEKIDLALSRLREQMGEFYRVDLRLPVTVDKPTQWKLEVIDEKGKPNREVEVHYPQQLMPCAKASP
jgi:hypothetical protein